jgi:hypothetical protein
MTKTFFLLLLLLLPPAPLLAGGPPPVREMPALDYSSVLNALLKLGKFKPDSAEFLDAYAMAVHCDVVKGSFADEFRWNEAREALKKWIAIRGPKLPTRLAVKKKILFDRYDPTAKYYLFNKDTQLQKINTFNTNPRPNEEACDKPVAMLLPARFEVVTNNPLSIPGLRLSQEQAKDLHQKFEQVGNKRHLVYIRFNVDILDADYIGPSFFTKDTKGAHDSVWKVKATLHSVEFFSDPSYRNRFYYYVPL